MRHFRSLMTTAFFASFATVACQSEDTSTASTQDTDVQSVEVTTATEPSDFVQGRFEFDGGPVTISIRLSSDEPSIPNQGTYTETFPPMPMIIDTFNVYQLEDGYRFFSRDAGLDVKGGNASEVTDFVLEQGADGAYLLTLNGEELASGQGPIITRGDYRLYSNGTGRDWSGTILAFTAEATDGAVTDVLAE